jgi:hypothetical protein
MLDNVIAELVSLVYGIAEVRGGAGASMLLRLLRLLEPVPARHDCAVDNPRRDDGCAPLSRPQRPYWLGGGEGRCPLNDMGLGLPARLCYSLSRTVEAALIHPERLLGDSRITCRPGARRHRLPHKGDAP